MGQTIGFCRLPGSPLYLRLEYLFNSARKSEAAAGGDLQQLFRRGAARFDAVIAAQLRLAEMDTAMARDDHQGAKQRGPGAGSSTAIRQCFESGHDFRLTNLPVPRRRAVTPAVRAAASQRLPPADNRA